MHYKVEFMKQFAPILFNPIKAGDLYESIDFILINCVQFKEF